MHVCSAMADPALRGRDTVKRTGQRIHLFSDGCTRTRLSACVQTKTGEDVE